MGCLLGPGRGHRLRPAPLGPHLRLSVGSAGAWKGASPTPLLCCKARGAVIAPPVPPTPRSQNVQPGGSRREGAERVGETEPRGWPWKSQSSDPSARRARRGAGSSRRSGDGGGRGASPARLRALGATGSEADRFPGRPSAQPRTERSQPASPEACAFAPEPL